MATRRGRTMGFPTANMHLGHCLAPAFGVYAVRVNITEKREAGGRHDGVANFGIRPMYQTKVPLMEAHLFDFDGDLYGKHLSVELIAISGPRPNSPIWMRLSPRSAADAAKAREILALTPQTPTWTGPSPLLEALGPCPKIRPQPPGA